MLWLVVYWLLRRLVGLLARGADGQRELELVVLRYQIKLLSRQASGRLRFRTRTGRCWPRRRCSFLASDAPVCWWVRPRSAAGIGSSFTGDRRALTASQADHRSAGTDPAGNPIAIDGRGSEVIRRQPDGTWLIPIDDPQALA